MSAFPFIRALSHKLDAGPSVKAQGAAQVHKQDEEEEEAAAEGALGGEGAQARRRRSETRERFVHCEKWAQVRCGAQKGRAPEGTCGVGGEAVGEKKKKKTTYLGISR